MEFKEKRSEGILAAVRNEEMCVKHAWVSALLLPCVCTPTSPEAVCVLALQTRTRILPPSRRSVSQFSPCVSPRTLLQSGGE